MKLTLILVLLLIVSVSGFTQNKTYRFKLGQVLQEYNLATATKGANHLIKDTYIFEVVTVINGEYVIWLLEFDEETSYEGAKGKGLNAELYKNASGVPIYFIVPLATWNQFAVEIYKRRGIAFGIINIPMKLRFANTNDEHRPRLLELDANVNLGLSFSPYWKNGEDQIWFTPVGITITQIKVDATNTLNYIAQTENRSGFSVFGGVVYQKQDYQIGLLIGADMVTGDVSKYWVYQGKPWLGIGIGIGLFQPNNKPVKDQSH